MKKCFIGYTLCVYRIERESEGGRREREGEERRVREGEREEGEGGERGRRE